ncbi:HAD family hydrolase [Amycolatopsis anabasis]|uniref:HAD family hydrolase n=1 Tax=Amycolatopsis anabasis TaxID=1840409 RepID=UPI00131DFD37|nr:HAD family hydrolase [Amycolatopsis anabasis]
MEINCSALLLDIDGTLVNSLGAVERTWRAWAAEYGLDGDAVLRVCHGRRSEETIADFLPGEQVESAVARLDELELADLDGVVACAGAAELLAANRLPWAVVTSGIVALGTARMKAAGFSLPEVFITAESVTEGKPAPECYRLAARKLGVPAGDCVVIEDAPAGVRAGRAAGATVVAVTTTHRAEELGDADFVVPSLDHVTVRGDQIAIAGGGGECVAAGR